MSRPTPETDSRKAHRNASGYNIDLADLLYMHQLERERDEAREAVAKLHDWLSVANNWLTECRTIYGETYAWPVNNDDLDQIPTILKDLDHLIP